MLYSNYGLTYDSEMDITIEMVRFAIEKEVEKSLWDLYLVSLPQMNKKTYISFNAFKKKAKQSQKYTKDISDEEIINIAKGVEERLLGNKNKTDKNKTKNKKK